MKLPSETMKALTETVFAANSGDTQVLTDRQVCADCIVTAMVVTRRRTVGNEATLAVSWDDSSYSKVSADLVNIYQAVMANKDCKLQ